MDGTADGWDDIKGYLPEDLPIVSLPMTPRPTRGVERYCRQHEPAELHLPDPDELATIVYTSGSTGRPKGVMHSFRTMISVADGLQQIFPVTTEEACSHICPWRMWPSGRRFRPNPFTGFGCANSLDTFQQDLQQARPTLFFSVPRLWTKFYLTINEKLPPRSKRFCSGCSPEPLVKHKVLKQLVWTCKAALTGAAPLPGEIVAGIATWAWGCWKCTACPKTSGTPRQPARGGENRLRRCVQSGC